MGTRNLIAVKIDDKYRIAQYCQWDGYPSGQGVDILNFLLGYDRSAFESKVRSLGEFYTDQELNVLWNEAGADPNTGMIDFESAKKFGEKMPELSRDTGSGILQIVMDSPNGFRLSEYINFAGDSLYCEWAYVIDLDRGTFEVFEGFNKDPLHQEDRFYNFPSAREGYYPVKLRKCYSLDSLPGKEQFFNDFECE